MVLMRCSTGLKSTLVQLAASVLANLGILNSGIVLGFPSAVLPPLLGSGPGLHATLEQASWVAGLMFISAPAGCLVAGPLVDWLGRRRGLMLLNLSFASGWLVIAVFPSSLIALYAGRLLTGFGLGLSSCASITYTAEVVSASLRTTLVVLTPFMMSIGTAVIYTWALFYRASWKEATYFSLGLTILSMLLTPLLPESPMWLLTKGHTERAAEALQKLRAAAEVEDISAELATFRSRVKEKGDSASTLRLLSQPQAYKPLIIMNLFFLFQQMSGVTIVIVFAVEFSKNVGSEADPYLIALGISLTRTLAAVITSGACSHYGRRRPAIWSGIVMTATLLGLTLNSFLPLPSWLSEPLILLFVLSSSIGFSSLPWSMLGELFPTDVRGIASGMTACVVYLESFISVKLYPGLVVSFGVLPTFIFFAVSGLLGTIYLFIFLPETHGKTLLEIEEYFSRGSNFNTSPTKKVSLERTP
ncbi:facilitated trehalose transporter Tret1-like [Macrosteles quadrilineatus]|uniref:facilitated trehalose transporter Tret1-like n=1 Tax=Macrosteles quadrilineatus TaxID=74068 RepID=UPI0023E2BE50|nr:facilitated trehalose transporter Tret1-like [Macrosteles quadrilineatus]